MEKTFIVLSLSCLSAVGLETPQRLENPAPSIYEFKQHTHIRDLPSEKRMNAHFAVMSQIRAEASAKGAQLAGKWVEELSPGAKAALSTDLKEPFLIPIINAIGFVDGETNLDRSSHFANLGLKIKDMPVTLFRNSYHQKRLVTICFASAGGNLAKASAASGETARADLYLSAAQYYYWASLHAHQPKAGLHLWLRSVVNLHKAKLSLSTADATGWDTLKYKIVGMNQTLLSNFQQNYFVDKAL